MNRGDFRRLSGGTLLLIMAAAAVWAMATSPPGPPTDWADVPVDDPSLLGAVDGPVIRYPAPDPDAGGDDALVGGFLQLNDGCLYVGSESGTGERYVIVWPATTRWDPDSQTVVLPGDIRVELGDEVTGGGGEADPENMATWLSKDAAALATRCTDNQHGDAMAFNNWPDAARLAD